ncbi:hypothetical protein VTL71DRAFT_3040 [Oculimacula yallundae]|uniref:Uncharacterized protein n=1 Tax=Oculimacula yallundae TaxID=86028 RepID=A0ABR4C5Z4_9HELO
MSNQPANMPIIPPVPPIPPSSNLATNRANIRIAIEAYEQAIRDVEGLHDELYEACTAIFKQDTLPVQDWERLQESLNRYGNVSRSTDDLMSRLNTLGANIKKTETAVAQVEPMIVKIDSHSTAPSQAIIAKAFAVILRAYDSLDPARDLNPSVKQVLINRERDRVQKKLEDAQSICEELKTNQELNTKLGTLEVSQLKKENKEKTTAIESLTTEKVAVEKQLLDVSGQLDIKKQEVKLARSQKEATEQKVDGLSMQVRKTDQSLLETQQQLAAKTQALIAAGNSLTAAEAQLEETNRNLKSALLRKTYLRTSRDRASKEVAELTVGVNKAKADLILAHNAMEELRSQNQDKILQVTNSYNTWVIQTTHRIDELIGKNKILDNTLTQVRSEADDAQADIQRLTRLLEVEKTAHEETRTLLSRAQTSNSSLEIDLQNANGQLEITHQALNTANNSLRTRGDVLRRVESDLVNTTTDLRGKISKITKYLEAANEQTQTQDGEITRLKQSNGEKDVKITGLEGSITSLQEQFAAKVESLRIADDSLTSKDREIETMNKAAVLGAEVLATEQQKVVKANESLIAKDLEIHQLESLLDAETEALDSEKQKVLDANTSITAKDDEIRQLKLRLKTETESLDSEKQKVLDANATITAIGEELDQMQYRLASETGFLNAEKEKVKQANLSITAKEGDIQRLGTAVEEGTTLLSEEKSKHSQAYSILEAKTKDLEESLAAVNLDASLSTASLQAKHHEELEKIQKRISIYLSSSFVNFDKVRREVWAELADLLINPPLEPRILAIDGHYDGWLIQLREGESDKRRSYSNCSSMDLAIQFFLAANLDEVDGSELGLIHVIITRLHEIDGLAASIILKAYDLFVHRIDCKSLADAVTGIAFYQLCMPLCDRFPDFEPDLQPWAHSIGVHVYNELLYAITQSLATPEQLYEHIGSPFQHFMLSFEQSDLRLILEQPSSFAVLVDPSNRIITIVSKSNFVKAQESDFLDGDVYSIEGPEGYERVELRCTAQASHLMGRDLLPSMSMDQDVLQLFGRLNAGEDIFDGLVS